jgi:hypothetical protein
MLRVTVFNASMSAHFLQLFAGLYDLRAAGLLETHFRTSEWLHGSIGWKTAEYVAASRCIVSQPILNEARTQAAGVDDEAIAHRNGR